MSAELQAKLDEISLLVVMAGPGDSQGLDFITDLIREVERIAESTGGHERLVQAARNVCAQRSEPTFHQIVTEFTTSALSYIAGSAQVQFIGERGDSS